MHLRVAAPFLAGYFLSYYYRAANAIVGPILAEQFGLSAAALGFLSAVYFLAFALFQLPLGVLLDRYGPRRVDAALLCVAALGAAWFAVATSEAELIAARALLGLGVSGCLMSAFTAFVLWYRPERIAFLNGIAFATGIVGAIAASVPLEWLLRALSWREVFAALAAFNLAVVAAILLVVPERRGPAGGERLGEQLKALLLVARDPAFWRAALCVGASQMAAVSLSTLWVATWLRDLLGWSASEVAQALLAFNVAMMAGYLGFGRAADALARRGGSVLPLVAGGLALALAALFLLLAGVRQAALLLWCLYFGCTTAVVLVYPILSRRHPKAMAGRVNTALNVFVFAGMFAGQWLVGLVLSLWPQVAGGYDPRGYGWSIGLLWLAQAAGLAWLWAGRRHFAAPAPTGRS